MNTQSRWNFHNLSFRDQDYSPNERESIWETCPQLAALDPFMAHTFMDDFHYFNSAQAAVPDGIWTANVTDAIGTTGDTDAAGGVLRIDATAVNENETYISSQAESWLFLAAKPLWFEAKIWLTESNVDNANWIIGLSDTVAANSLLNAGAGPMAAYDGACFFKVDGTMQIQTETSNAGAQVTAAAAQAFVSGQHYRLGIWFNAAAANNVLFYIDGVLVATHTLALAGLAEMHILMGVKAGNVAGTAEDLMVDYVKCVQIR